MDWKNHEKLRMVLIALFFVVGMVLTVVGWKMTGQLKGLRLHNDETGEDSEIFVDGTFLAVGLMPENEAFAHLTQLNSWGYFDSDESCTTTTPGLFVAGDCRSKTIRQVVTAAGDGAIAAMAACRYLD